MAAPATPSVNITSFGAALKTLYDGQDLAFLYYQNKPFLDLVDKEENFYGNEAYPIPISLTNPGGGSATYANALTNQTASTYKTFLLPRVLLYQLQTISREALLASSNDAGAFLKAQLAEMKSMAKMQTRQINLSLFGTGNWVRGFVGNFYKAGAWPAGTVGSGSGQLDAILLSNPRTVVQFEQNISIDTAVVATGSGINGGTASVRGGAGATPNVITNIDRSNGLLFMASGSIAANFPNIAIGDGIVRDGDANLGANGLPGWLPNPTVAPGDSFLGVDRSVDSVRLAGVAFDGRQFTLKEALTEAAMAVFNEGGSPDTIIISVRKWGDLSILMDTKSYQESLSGDSGFGYKYLTLDTPEGSLRVLADNACPDSIAFILELDTWHLKSLGPLVDLVSDDGVNFLRVYNQDAFEFRIASMYNLYSDKPGHNGSALLN